MIPDDPNQRALYWQQVALTQSLWLGLAVMLAVASLVLNVVLFLDR